MEKIYGLWKSKYYHKHLAQPNKNTVSVERDDLSIFYDTPWIKSLNLKPVSAFFGVTPPHSIMAPHKDPSSNPEIIAKGFPYHPWALNVPLTCDYGTFTRFHRVRTGAVTRLDGAGHSPYNNVRVPMANEADLIEVATIALDRPMLLNTSEWHSVSNTTDEVRLVFSLRFDPLMTLPEASKRLTSMLA